MWCCDSAGYTSGIGPLYTLVQIKSYYAINLFFQVKHHSPMHAKLKSWHASFRTQIDTHTFLIISWHCIGISAWYTHNHNTARTIITSNRLMSKMKTICVLVENNVQTWQKDVYFKPDLWIDKRIHFCVSKHNLVRDHWLLCGCSLRINCNNLTFTTLCSQRVPVDLQRHRERQTECCS